MKKKNSFVVALSLAFSATLSVGFVNVTPKVIYGEDNRKDLYQIENAQIKKLAESTVALIDNKHLIENRDGQFILNSLSFGEERNLCSAEPFREQPAAANCSGFLVAPDLVATAGHCLNEANCKSFYFVFGYQMIDSSIAPALLPAEDVYSCKRVEVRQYTSGQDYALIRLDRPVINRQPLTLAKEPALEGDDVFVIGHPAGLPTKVADGAKVRHQDGSFFQTDLDTYGGNSGSAVFNAFTKEVVGILVRGAQDYVYDTKNQCMASSVCAQDSCRGEDVTNIYYVINSME